MLQAAALTADLDVCRAGIERLRVDGLQLAGMSSVELYALAVAVGGNHLKEQLFEQLSLVKQECEAQEATMRRFEEYVAAYLQSRTMCLQSVAFFELIA